MADEQILKIFAGKQSEVPDGEMLRDDHQYIATEARRKYVLESLAAFQAPRFLARSLEMRVIVMHVGGCGAEIISRGRLMYRKGADDRETGTNLFHGIAHDITPSPCSHGDIWIVTAELALPPIHVIGQPLERLYRWQPHVSTWFIDAWAERVNHLYGSVASGW